MLIKIVAIIIVIIRVKIVIVAVSDEQEHGNMFQLISVLGIQTHVGTKVTRSHQQTVSV